MITTVRQRRWGHDHDHEARRPRLLPHVPRTHRRVAVTGSERRRTLTPDVYLVVVRRPFTWAVYLGRLPWAVLRRPFYRRPLPSAVLPSAPPLRGPAGVDEQLYLW